MYCTLPGTATLQGTRSGTPTPKVLAYPIVEGDPLPPHYTPQTDAPPTGEDSAAAHARAEARAAERLGGGLAFGQTSSSLSLPPRADAGEGAPDVVPHPARTPRDPDADAGARAQGDGQTLVPKEQGSGRPFLDPVRPAPRILGHAPQPEPEPAESSAP